MTYEPWADFVHALYGVLVVLMIVRVVVALFARLERRL